MNINQFLYKNIIIRINYSILIILINNKLHNNKNILFIYLYIKELIDERKNK